MPETKKAYTRYLAYDRCLKDSYNQYGPKELMSIANEALAEEGLEGIAKSQFYKDIDFLTYGPWEAPIEKYRDGGRHVLYRYSDREYSIRKQALSENEKDQLKDAVAVLTRFSGLPQFDWIHNMIPEMETKLDLRESERELMSFDSNENYMGTQWIQELYQALRKKQALVITYLPFHHERAYVYTFHINYLKQYNGRWFACGLHENKNIPTWIFALDRIQSIEPSENKYIESVIDWSNYFRPIIGVTRKFNQQPEEIQLSIDPERWPYIETKPLHHSQRLISKTDKEIIIAIEIIPNNEFEAVIASHMGKVQIIKEK